MSVRDVCPCVCGVRAPVTCLCLSREKKKEQEREELWKKLDELKLSDAAALVQNNSHGLQNAAQNNNNNNNHHDNQEKSTAISADHEDPVVAMDTTEGVEVVTSAK